MIRRNASVGLALASVLAGSAIAQSVDSSFTYQGEIQELGVPADGLHDLQFSLFGSADGGDQVGSTLCVNDVLVIGGRFSVVLDFGQPFNGSKRFLQVEVRADSGADCSAPTNFELLGPRQELTAAPNAAFSLNAGLLNGQNGAYYLNASNIVAGSLDAARLPGGGAWNVTSNLNIDDETLFIDHASNRVGIGTAHPSAKLSVAGPMTVGSIYSNGTAVTHGQGTHIEWNKFSGDGATWILNQKGLGLGGIWFGEVDNGNTVTAGMHLAANGFLTVTGRVSATTVEIRGGADIVEGFTAAAPIEPGAVVVIDAVKAGEITTSTTPYDTKVVGVVSGANGVNAGMKLGHAGVLDGDVQVAMTGRVYVKCSAENGPIVAGDRLTTASLRGHAMKVTDSSRADGAVIGKAMSSLDAGTGYVLVVVNLQ